MVKRQPFNTEQGAYLDYLRRWKKEYDEEPTRVHFTDFVKAMRRLAEVSFYLIALKNDNKTRGGQYPKLVKERRELCALLLIEPDSEETQNTEEEEEEKEEVEDADDVPTTALLEEANSFEDRVKEAREGRQRADANLTKPDDDDGLVGV